MNRNLLLGCVSSAFGLSGFALYRATDQRAKTPDSRNITYASKSLTVLPRVKFRKPIPAEKQLIFLHIPKTGGTNLNFIAEALSSTKPDFHYQRFSANRDKTKSSIKIDAGWAGAFDVAKAQLTAHPEFAQAQVIGGHFPVGLHAALPNAKYIALMRNPFDRLLSRANFNYQRGAVNANNIEAELLSEIDNPQTRMFAGIEHMEGQCTEMTLQKACENIEKHFLLVGITEETNLYLAIISAIQNWGDIAVVKSQVTGRKLLDKVPATVETEVASRHFYDIALYDWVKKRWDVWKKENIASYATVNENDVVLCITEAYAASRMPVLLTASQILERNRANGDALVASHQKYTAKL